MTPGGGGTRAGDPRVVIALDRPSAVAHRAAPLQRPDEHPGTTL